MKKVNYFNVRKTLENKYIICIKDQLASRKTFNSEKDAVRYINSKPWELIMMLLLFITNKK